MSGKRLCFALLAMALWAPALSAQSNVVSTLDNVSQVEVITRVPIPRAALPGWVPVEVTLTNKKETPARRELIFRCGNSWDHTALATLNIDLEPKQEITLDLILPYFGPSFGEQIRLELKNGTSFERSSIYSVDSSSSNNSSLPMLVVTNTGFDRVERFAGQSISVGGRTETASGIMRTTQPIGVLADQLPEDWRGYSTLGAVVIDLDAPLPSRGAMDAIVRWVGLGGTLAFFGSEPNRATELLSSAGLNLEDRFRAEIPRQTSASYRHGFGRIVVPEQPNPTDDSRSLLSLPEGMTSPLGILPRNFLAMPPALPGVGLPPLSLLTFLLIVVALVLGPIQFEQLKRRKAKPWKFLIVTPILGIAFTIFVLGFSLLSQGTGVRESVQSVTWLDQERKVANTVAGRTSFSGSLLSNTQRFGSEALIVPSMLTSGSDEYEYRINLNDEYALSGHFMPTRVPASTTLAASRSARAGLRIERENGELYAIHDFDQELNRVRFRDGDGEHYRPLEDRSIASGERVRLEKVDQIFEVRLAERATPPEVVINYGLLPVEDTSVGIDYRRMGHLPPILYPRMWMAEVDRSPFLPDGGLRRKEEHASHLILGQLEAQS